jgi:hypothetical protein
MRRLLSAALLAASFIAPCTVVQADTSPKTLAETVGPRFRGMASTGKKRWPFVVYDIKVLEGDNFEAAINWTSQGSIRKIEGTFKNGLLSFKETEAIQKGEALLGCEYQIDTKRVTNGQAQGHWDHCTGSSNSGNVAVFLPVVNKWTPNPAGPQASKGPDMDAAGQFTAWADYAESNCTGLGVDHAKLEDFVKSAGATMSEAKQSSAYKKAIGELIPHDVAKYGVQQFCYLLQLQFYQPGNLKIHKIIFKY